MSFLWNAWSPVNLALDALVLAASAALAWVSLRRGDRTNARVLAAAFWATAPWCALAAFPGGLPGLFLTARALWTLATVGLPLAAVGLAWARRDARWLLVAAAALTLKAEGEVWEPDRLEVQRVSVPVAGLKAAVRVVHLSDLQTDDVRRMHRRAQEASDAFDPDLIVFTGDVLNHPSLVPEVTAYLRPFRRRHGAFIVGGDVDGVLDWPSFTGASGFELLDGKARTLSVGPNRVALLGLAVDDAWNKPLFERLLGETGAADARLLLSHRPDALELARGAPVDVLFAGHTHGGQVCLPWFGPIVTLSRVSRAIAAGGLHRVGDLQVLVSRGLGWEGHIAPRVRLFCRPHLLLVELVPAGT